MAQGTRDRTAGIALGATVLVQAGIAWWLLGLTAHTPPRGPAALAVTWIERPALLPSPLQPLAQPIKPAPVAATTAAKPRSTLQAVVRDPLPAVPDALLPTAADLLQQAGDWARTQAPAADFSHDPLRQRPGPRGDGRFAMRRQVSPEDVVKGIGQLLGGPGYSEDPCPQIRRNIANAASGADPALAAEEVRRLQRFCL